MITLARISIMMIVIMSISPLVSAADKMSCDSDKPLSVFIDPFFGGAENGPNIGQEYKGKNLVLSFGLKLKALLEKKGITACLSRDGDYSLNLDQRLVKAKVSQPKVYFAIAISSSSESESCINLCISREAPRTTRKEKDIDLDSILKDIKSDDKRERSLVLAHRLQRSIGENLKQICGKVLAKDQALLTKSHGPTVMLDFSVTDDSLPFMRKTILADSFVALIADALEAYLTSDQSAP